MVGINQIRHRIGRWISGGRIDSQIGGGDIVRSGDGSAVWPLTGIGGVDFALQSGAVWACCRVISEPIGALPTHIFEKTAEGKVRAVNHPYYNILTLQPNPTMTMSQMIQATVLNLLVYGNAFWYPSKVGDSVFGLYPLDPARMEIDSSADGIYGYRYFDKQGRTREYATADLLHFRMFSLDGVIGLSPLDYHRLTLEFEAASKAYASTLMMNGGRPSGVLEFPNQLKKEQHEKIRESWKAIHSGIRGAGEVAILDWGAKYTPIGMQLSQLEYTAQQRATVEQIARIYGVPLHLVNAADKPTYASVEQQSLEFVQYRIQPIVTSMEQTIRTGLLTGNYIYKFQIAAFQRSDIKTRYAAYSQGRQWGWLSVNDIRELEDLNQIGPGGDVYLQPLNMAAAGTADPPETLVEEA